MKDKVLVVEDEIINMELMLKMLEKEYDVITARNGREALEILEKRHTELSVVLLDLVLPEIDGMAVLKVMHDKKWIKKVPVLIVTSQIRVNIEEKCFEYGVSDYIKKPLETKLLIKRVNNVVKLFKYQNALEQTVEKQMATLRKQYKLLKVQSEKLSKSNENIINILGSVVEYRSLENGEHIRRVKGFTNILAKELMLEYPDYGLSEEDIQTITEASALHDIGKIAISDQVLMKPGRLTDKEYEYMKSHAARGGEIIERIKDVWDKDYQKVCYEICRHHHERYDGNGYPDRLSGDDIPISAQIVSIADAYDALISERVYKNAYPKDEAYRMILMGECGVFSPRLLECFRNARSKFEELADKFDDEYTLKDKKTDAGSSE